MSDKLKKQKKEWKEKLKLLTDKHKQQLLQVNNCLHDHMTSHDPFQYSDRIQVLEETNKSHEGYENESMKQELINLHQVRIYLSIYLSIYLFIYLSMISHTLYTEIEKTRIKII